MPKNVFSESFLKDRYRNIEALAGDEDVKKPNILRFRNSDMACEMLREYINNGIEIRIHGDVDMDGIGTTKILNSFVQCVSPNHKTRLCINKSKVHGIASKHVEYFNKIENCLVVILDSGTNNIEYIKQIKHDVLVIDHHNAEVDQFSGDTANGKYCIVNNTIASEGYTIKNNMSAGLVTLELLRYMQEKYEMGDIIEDKLLYQWAVITLFTDVIDNDDLRNIYYIDKAFADTSIEPGLRELMNRICPYNRGFKTMDKSFISFSLAPTFNRAIRAGRSNEAIDIAINTPRKVEDLLKLKGEEALLLSDYLDGAIDNNSYTTKDVTDGVGKNYCGITASKLMDHFRQSTTCYVRVGDRLDGSFRGSYQDIDYRKIVADLGYFAQGHPPAFGFKVPSTDLNKMMEAIVNAEISKEHREYLTAGDIDDEYKGIYHLDTEEVLKFKQAGYAWKIGTLNSKIANNSSCINIVVSRKDIQVTTEYENRSEYNCLGFKGCVAFEPIASEYAYLYIEYANELKFYLRNKWK